MKANEGGRRGGETDEREKEKEGRKQRKKRKGKTDKTEKEREREREGRKYTSKHFLPFPLLTRTTVGARVRSERRNIPGG